MHKSKSLTLVIVFLCAALSAQSQYISSAVNTYMAFKAAKENGNAGFFHRMSTGGGKFFINNKVFFTYKKSNGMSATIERDLTAGSSMYFEDNYFFLLSGLGEKSTLTLTYGGFAGLMNLVADPVTLEDDVTYKLELPAMVGGIPLSLDYKYGGEATLNKHDKTLFTLGLGVAPGFYMNYNDLTPMPFRAVPFVKAELGFFCGLAFKLKASTFLARGNYLNYVEYYRLSDDDVAAPDRELEVRSKGSLGYSLTLMVMPFSFDWSKDWNF